VLVDLEERLVQQGASDYEFLIVGDGSERTWLSKNMKRCRMPGVLLGSELAKAYASMDVFVFPSATDTFGNVVLEAMASGVPTLVSGDGGPKYFVQHGTTGFVAKDVAEFARYLLDLHADPQLRSELSQNARRVAGTFSWSTVFENVYEAYNRATAAGLLRRTLASSASRPLLSSTL
jgi:phosphatidylinositol alpha 1,6-mannosyltransferase